MTTNHDYLNAIGYEMADIIEKYVDRTQLGHGYANIDDGLLRVDAEIRPEDLARDFDQEGLLMPDLPEPEMYSGRLIWRVDTDGYVYIKPDGRISTIGVGNPYDSPTIAHRHALALTAAANYAERENPDA